MKLIIISMMLTSLAFAHCNYEKKGTELTWTGFKLAKKVGVSGTFDKYSVTANEAKKPFEVIKSARFSIDASTINSKNKARDIKLAKHIFSTLEGGANITGKVVGYNDGKALVEMTMNGVTQKVIMAHTTKGNRHTLETTVDMFSFQMQDEHKAIAKACSAKHKGKTWTDVDVKIAFDINCKKAPKK